MREKSSSVLTSFSSRRLLRCAMSSACCGAVRQRARRLAQQFLERAQHQRERRAELVRDVREERGLGAVELGEALGAPPFVFERLGVGQAGGDLRRHQLEERAVAGRRALASGLTAVDENRRADGPGRAAARAAPARVCGAVFQAPVGSASKREARSVSSTGCPEAATVRNRPRIADAVEADAVGRCRRARRDTCGRHASGDVPGPGPRGRSARRARRAGCRPGWPPRRRRRRPRARRPWSGPPDRAASAGAARQSPCRWSR